MGSNWFVLQCKSLFSLVAQARWVPPSPIFVAYLFARSKKTWTLHCTSCFHSASSSFVGYIFRLILDPATLFQFPSPWRVDYIWLHVGEYSQCPYFSSCTKELGYTWLRQPLGGLRNCQIKIYAPNLVSLRYSSFCYLPNSYFLCNLLSLVDANIDITTGESYSESRWEEIGYCASKLLGRFSNVKVIKISAETFKVCLLIISSCLSDGYYKDWKHVRKLNFIAYTWSVTDVLLCPVPSLSPMQIS